MYDAGVDSLRRLVHRAQRVRSRLFLGCAYDTLRAPRSRETLCCSFFLRNSRIAGYQTNEARPSCGIGLMQSCSANSTTTFDLPTHTLTGTCMLAGERVRGQITTLLWCVIDLNQPWSHIG